MTELSVNFDGARCAHMVLGLPVSITLQPHQSFSTMPPPADTCGAPCG